MTHRDQLEHEVAQVVARAATSLDVPAPAPGRHEELQEVVRRAHRAWQRVSFDGTAEEQARLVELGTARARRDAYLRRVLSALPFRWHVEHNYAVRETATYGGADHVVVDEVVQLGRATRQPGDTLSAPRGRFRGLHPLEEHRLPTARRDIRVAERIAGNTGTGSALAPRRPRAP